VVAIQERRLGGQCQIGIGELGGFAPFYSTAHEGPVVPSSFPPGFARPAAHETLLLCGGVAGTEVGSFLVRLSPSSSWTRGTDQLDLARTGTEIGIEPTVAKLEDLVEPIEDLVVVSDGDNCGVLIDRNLAQ
jgi:hypothetical protein